MTLRSVFAGFLLLLPQIVAAARPIVPCVAGMPCTAQDNVIVNATVPQFGLFMLRVAGGLALIYVIIAGLKLMTAQGDDSAIADEKKAVRHAIIGLVVAILAQSAVSAIATYERFDLGDANDLVVGALFVYIVDIALTFVNLIFVIMTIVMGYKMVMSHGKTDEFNTARKGLLWVISGALLINISHIMIRIVLTQFGV